jgi:hypothetical protein
VVALQGTHTETKTDAQDCAERRATSARNKKGILYSRNMGVLADAADFVLLLMCVFAALLCLRIILKPFGIDEVIGLVWNITIDANPANRSDPLKWIMEQAVQNSKDL